MTEAKSNSRIAVVGCGAVGQFYAAQLAHAGHRLYLLARRDATRILERGIIVKQTPAVQVKSTLTHPCLRIEPSQLTVATSPESLVIDGHPDWVLVALKTTALHAARALVEPLLGPRTRIVVLCNGLGVEDHFAEWFGGDRVFGLLCFVAVNRDVEAVLHHQAFGHVIVGHYWDDLRSREELQQLFEGAGIECECPRSLLEARWRKLGWNVPFNGLCLLYDCTTDAIVTDRERRGSALELALETVRIGNLDLVAHGRSARIETDWADLQLARTDTMGAYAPSTLLDARAGRELETEMIFVEPARRARKLGTEAPAIERLVRGLRAKGLVPDETGTR